MFGSKKVTADRRPPDAIVAVILAVAVLIGCYTTDRLVLPIAAIGIVAVWAIHQHRQFTIRRLLIFVAFVCVYLAAWDLTRRVSVSGLKQYDLDHRVPVILNDNACVRGEDHSPVPFVVTRQYYLSAGITDDGTVAKGRPYSSDVFLCFGPFVTKFRGERQLRTSQ